MSFEIRPFDSSMLTEAGALLSLRHRRLRAAQPELPAAFEEAGAARGAVEAVWGKERGEGVVAVRDGRLLGYLIGDVVIDPLWGRSAWVRFAGCALALDQDPETVRDLYAALGEKWVAWGCFAHFALMPCADAALLDRWFALSFGIEHVHGTADLEALDLSPRPDPPGVTIRRAGPEDRGHLEDLSDVIWRHLVQAPCWGIHLPERDARERVEWGDLVEDPNTRLWLAFCDGEVAGVQGYDWDEAARADPLIPEQCAGHAVAGTRAPLRGRGIARALSRHVLAHARSHGFRFCATDWRGTNLTASRVWPRLGFRPVAYRLVRRVDPRIAWAAGQAEA
jgi:GNAT superfamily N-acetyltransferase